MSESTVQSLLREAYANYQRQLSLVAQAEARIIGIADGSGLSPEEVNDILGGQVFAPAKDSQPSAE